MIVIEHDVTLNRFAYADCNPVMNVDPTGHSAERGNLLEYGYIYDVNAFEIIYLSENSVNRRPYTGEPNSTWKSPNGDTRTYGPDGKPVHYYDHSDHGNPSNHPHDENGGHNHDWTNGVRGPAYSSFAGVIIVVGATLAIGYVMINDITGVGVADDGLLVPLATTLGAGVSMIGG